MTSTDLGPQVTFAAQPPQVHVQITEPGVGYLISGTSDAGFVVDAPTLESGADDPEVQVQAAEYTYRPQPVQGAAQREARHVIQDGDPPTLTLPSAPVLTSAFLFVNGLQQRPVDWSYVPDTRTVHFHDHALYPGDELSLVYTPEYL